MDDPDYAGQDVCWSADRALVVEVVETHPAMTRAEHVKSNAAFMTWNGGGPMYDDEGHMLPSPEMRLGGVRPDQLRSVGTWVSWEVMRQAMAVAGWTWAAVGAEVKRIVRSQESQVRSIRGRRRHQHP